MRKMHILWTMILALAMVTSCFKDKNFEAGFDGGDSTSRTVPERSESEPTRRVMIMVSAGYNSLSGYLKDDLKELESGYLPEGKYMNSDVLLVLARTPEASGKYPGKEPTVLYRLYTDRTSDHVHKDTLKVWDSRIICDASTINEALTFIYRQFPAKSYGMVFSSHASGWLPEGYYSDPSKFEPESSFLSLRSIGQDMTPSGGVEMEIKEFADAIPMHLDYLLLDACLSGCVEVAYELKDKADVVGFSPTEVLANGFDYKTITGHLLGGAVPDPVAVCRDYFEYYNAQSGSNRSATITVVDTRKMGALAAVCEELFEAYRTKIQSLNGNVVQGYFRMNRHYFYDLKDILVQAGISADETASLDAALSECLLYQAATPYFLGIELKRVCGLSMYLPSMGSDFLDNYYRNSISWNNATQLVK